MTQFKRDLYTLEEYTREFPEECKKLDWDDVVFLNETYYVNVPKP